MTVPPLLAGLLSVLLPGLGQLSKRRFSQGLSFLCMSLGTAAAIALALIGPAGFRSKISAALLALVYLFILFPASIDAMRPAGRSSKTLSGERMWYVVFMLLMVGPAALPLLWQSPRFSRKAKWGWTIFVLFIFLSCLFLMLVVMPKLEQVMRSFGLQI